MTAVAIRWMRVVLPTPVIGTAAFMGEILIEFFYVMSLARGWQPDEEAFRVFRVGWLTLTASYYGVFRVAKFHPVFNDAYRSWLESTPWTAEKPLPGGPVRIVFQDLVVLAGLVLLAREVSMLALLIPLGFLTGYLLALAFTARFCGDWQMAYLLFFGLGAIGLARTSTLVCFTVALCCSSISPLVIRRSLQRFPWNMSWKKAIRTNQSRSNSFTDRLGWPHDFLSPKPPKPWVAISDGICLSLLAGWYVFILHTQLPSAHAGICIGVIQPVMIGLLIRLGNFASVHRPPISVLGRVSTGQWIIPSYDVIFVGPLLSMIVLLATQLGGAGLEMMNGPLNNRLNPRLDWCITVLSSCGVTIAMLLAFLMGPRLERWRLAASHRIVFDVTNRDSHAPFAEL